MAEKRENAHMWVTVMGGGFSILYGLLCALREVDVPFLLLFILRLVFDIYSVQCRNELYLSSRKPIPSELPTPQHTAKKTHEMEENFPYSHSPPAQITRNPYMMFLFFLNVYFFSSSLLSSLTPIHFI